MPDAIINCKILIEYCYNDIYDPDEHLRQWSTSEAAQFLLEHAVEPPVMETFPDPWASAYIVAIRVKLRQDDHTFYRLKWGFDN